MGTSSTTSTSTTNPAGLISQQQEYPVTPVQDVDQPSLGAEVELNPSILNQPHMHVISSVSSSVGQVMPIGAMPVS